MVLSLNVKSMMSPWGLSRPGPQENRSTSVGAELRHTLGQCETLSQPNTHTHTQRWTHGTVLCYTPGPCLAWAENTHPVVSTRSQWHPHMTQFCMRCNTFVEHTHHKPTPAAMKGTAPILIASTTQRGARVPIPRRPVCTTRIVHQTHPHNTGATPTPRL